MHLQHTVQPQGPDSHSAQPQHIPTGPPRLPVSIMLRVVDHLWDDTDALKTCSVTYKAFITRCQSHLFHKLNIKNAWHYEALEKFVDEHSHIATYVQELAIKGSSRVGRQRDSTPFRILDHLFSVTQLVVIDWGSQFLSRGARNALRNRYQNLSSVSLVGGSLCKGDLQCLLTIPALQAFSIANICLENDILGSALALQALPRSGVATFRSHSISYVGPNLFQAVGDIILPDALKNVEVLVKTGENPRMLGRLLSRAEALAHFVIGTGDVTFGARWREHCTLTHNPHLQSMHIIAGNYAMEGWGAGRCNKKLVNGLRFWLTRIEPLHQDLDELCITVPHLYMEQMFTNAIDDVLHSIAVNRPEIVITIQVVHFKKGLHIGAEVVNKMRRALSRLLRLEGHVSIVCADYWDLDGLHFGGPHVASDWKKRRGRIWKWHAPCTLEVFQ